MNGAGGAGGATCVGSGCSIAVEYTCMGGGNEQISLGLDVVNKSAAPLMLSDLRIRYWFTMDSISSLLMSCDFSQIDCNNLGSQFMTVAPARTNANAYFDLFFLPRAGTLAPGANIGPTNLRVQTSPFSATFNQTDDYSYDCSKQNMAIESQLITAYVGGVLVWGKEPQ
jgi:hypothetical protein